MGEGYENSCFLLFFHFSLRLSIAYYTTSIGAHAQVSFVRARRACDENATTISTFACDLNAAMVSQNGDTICHGC